MLFCVTVGYRYYQYMVKKNFILEVNVACDPNTENCFKADCSGDGCDTSTYKKVTISAHDAPKCLEEHNCDTFTCTGISSCTMTYCSKDTLADGEVCTK